MTHYTAHAQASAQTPRIFCIGRNYARHIEELGHTGARECVVFMKPLTALVGDGESIAIPTHLGAVHHELELVVEIGRGGRHISADNAAQHIAGLGLGLDLTLREVQNELKATGEPWEKCKAFDHSAPLGSLCAFDTALFDLTDLEFRLSVNGECRQRGHTGMMLVGVRGLIAQLSTHWQLRPGDLVYTGTPEGVGAIAPGDVLQVSGDGLASARWTVAAEA